jgi:hypothetical protein
MRYLMFAATAVLMAHAAMAQGVPAELAGTKKSIRFLKMPATGNGCPIGVHRRTGKGKGGPMCQLSINECLTKAHGSIVKDSHGDWACKR